MSSIDKVHIWDLLMEEKELPPGVYQIGDWQEVPKDILEPE